MYEVTLANQIASVERELAMRARVYPRWVKDGKLTQEAADEEVRRMTAVRDTLRAQLPVQAFLEALGTPRLLDYNFPACQLVVHFHTPEALEEYMVAFNKAREALGIQAVMGSGTPQPARA